MDWQPIETAPKDGTKIVLYHPNYQSLPIGHWDYVEGGDEEDGGGSGYTWFVENELDSSMGDGILWPDEDMMPTLWQPLPNPPERKE